MSQAHVAAGEGVSIRGLHKRYGDTRALDGLDLEARPGEVLGVAGPNGAGKSTLIRILAGEERPDSGELRVAGMPWSTTRASQIVAVVHQEPQLFPNLSVAENMLVGRERSRFLRPRVHPDETALMKTLAIDQLASHKLDTCTLATQQRTEIARALAWDARVFLFDEPNSALTDEESDELFREMRALAAGGRIVLFVSHRLGDLVENATRVAIIRDGKVTATLEGDDLSEEAIAQQLVIGGQEREADLHAAEAEAAAAPASTLFSVTGWAHRGGAFAGIELSVAAGEIVALMGVEGSGGRELLRSLAQLEKATGTLVLADAPDRGTARRQSAYVSATRQLSLFSNLSVGENLVVRLGRPDIASSTLVLRRRHMRQLAEEAVVRFLVKAQSIAQRIRSLSGGNQQKVAIAQALASRPRLLLLEEPTRGVDIGSRREIYRLLHEFARDGNAVIMFCTEIPEIFEAADRVYVVSDGRLSASLDVAGYDHVEEMATDISRLERHGRTTSDRPQAG